MKRMRSGYEETKVLRRNGGTRTRNKIDQGHSEVRAGTS